MVVELVAAAAMAPSMHNTQPWRFRFDPASQTIGLYADRRGCCGLAIRMAARCILAAAPRCSTFAWPPPSSAASQWSG
jgi:hypothetical protein